MTERIVQKRFEGLDDAPDIIQKRILSGDADQHVHDVRSSLIVAGAPVPERVRDIAIYDVGVNDTGEHVLFAAIHRGKGAITSIVAVRGPTRDSARWILGAEHNITTLKIAYTAHRYVAKDRRWYNGELSADG